MHSHARKPQHNSLDRVKYAWPIEAPKVRYSLLNDMDQGNKRMAVVVGDNGGNRRGAKTFRSPWALSSLAGRFRPKLCSQTPSWIPFYKHKASGCSPLLPWSLSQSWWQPFSLPSLWFSFVKASWICHSMKTLSLGLLLTINLISKCLWESKRANPPLNTLSPLPCTTNHQNSPHQHREHLRPPQRIDSLTTRCHE